MFHHLDQLFRRIYRNPDRNPGILFPEFPYDLWKFHRTQRLDRPNVKWIFQFIRIIHGCFRLMNIIKDPVGMLQKFFPLRGKHHFLSCPVEQPFPKFVFQLADLNRHCRLRIPQHLCRSGKALHLRDLCKSL